MLGNLRISYKLLMMIGLSVLSIAAMAGLGLSALWDNMMEDRRAKLQDIVTIARETLDYDYQLSRKAGLSEAETMERAKALLRSMRFGKGDYVYAIDRQGVAASNPNPQVEGKNLMGATDPDGVPFVRRQLERASSSGSFLTFRFPRAAGGDPIPKLTYSVEFKPFDWIIGSGIYLDDVDAIFWQQARNRSIMVVLALLVIGGLFFLLGRSVVNPITAMTMAMRKIAEGDTATSIPALDRGDEVGAMAQSVKVFRDNMVEAGRLRGEQDVLKSQADSERKVLLARTADEFERGVRASLDSLSGAASDMQATSRSMSSTAIEASRQATSVAAVAEQASVNVQTVAAATEELSSSVSEIGRQVTQSTEIAGQAVAEANRTNVTVQGLSAAAQKIGDVVKLISDIASQTNLLALNATIEAARAGEAGRGFAVVANEVKSLASQTAKATDEISAQVGAMQDATTEAVQAIEGIGRTIGAINEITSAISIAVEQQGTATQEIARNVQEAALGTGQVSSNIAAVNQAAEKTGNASNGVLASAEQLSSQAAKLRADVDRFLANIRAA
ncbi:methyl-accepting chemotaxis protein [Bradyrhizobium sp.]|uniref:methyl-accepting chemotaxis protein n=1 Tax=Bradyrhizobium sp. TaxID=376 RepID=UPI00238528D0|nr:cache domain-containing protein [Bradyrhizobium sp.]MDE1936966.1 cache domain-containing protein [Bradyrhizobium sp.]